jgi:hypothetical protein
MHIAAVADVTTPVAEVPYETVVECAVSRTAAVMSIRRLRGVRGEIRGTACAEVWLTQRNTPHEPVGESVRRISNTAIAELATGEVSKVVYFADSGGRAVDRSRRAKLMKDEELHHLNHITRSRYLQAARQVCSDEEWRLLYERCVLEIPFETLAARSHTEPLARQREATRLRKQVQRLRNRCAQAVRQQYPALETADLCST